MKGHANKVRNPTSPLGDRWFRTCVSTSIPQLLHPMLRTVLEEGFSPPPTSSIGWYSHLSCRLFYGIGGPSEFDHVIATLVRKSSQDGFKMVPKCLRNPPPGNPGGHPGARLAGGGGGKPMKFSHSFKKMGPKMEAKIYTKSTKK